MNLNSRRFTWLVVIVIVVGLQAALITRLLLSDQGSLYWTFSIDPANLILVITLAVGLLMLVLRFAAQWLDRKLSSEALELTQKQEAERRRFIRRLDHELKNPLTAIQIQLDNLQDSTRQDTDLDDLRMQTNRLANLTRGLRRLADLETRPLEFERFEVEEMLQEVIDLLQAPDRINLELQKVPWPLPAIEADRELLLLAVRNVVANALNYSDDVVQVRARHAQGMLVLEVVDTGRGIPDDDLPHITEELYRGSNVHDLPGSGLGLSIVERIIERHLGHVEVMSRSNQGTIISLQIPYSNVQEV